MKTERTTATEKDLTPVILTADTLMNLVERVITLERQIAELRETVKINDQRIVNDMEESIDNVYKHCIPDIAPDGRLVFKAYNNIADPVQCFVQAEIIESVER